MNIKTNNRMQITRNKIIKITLYKNPTSPQEITKDKRTKSTNTTRAGIPMPSGASRRSNGARDGA